MDGIIGTERAVHLGRRKALDVGWGTSGNFSPTEVCLHFLELMPKTFSSRGEVALRTSWKCL